MGYNWLYLDMKNNLIFVNNSPYFYKHFVRLLPGLINKRFYFLSYIPKQFRDRVIFIKLNQTLDEKRTDFELIEKFPSESLRSGLLRATKKLDIKEPLFIYPQVYGTIGSYYVKSGDIFLRPRLDRKPEEVVRLLITATIHLKFYKNCSTTKDENFINIQRLAEEKYKLLYPKKKVTSTKRILDTNYSGKYAIESAKNIKQMGYRIKPYIKNIKKIKGLSQTERAILNELCENRNQLTSYDSIYALMDQNNEFSLYAISKQIERIRKKLKDNGILYELIHPYRGSGYVLYD